MLLFNNATRPPRIDNVVLVTATSAAAMKTTPARRVNSDKVSAVLAWWRSTGLTLTVSGRPIAIDYFW